MMTENGDFNDNGVPPLHELVEEAPVTRASALANAFAETFFDKFAEAELHDDKKFLLDVNEFDAWLAEQNLIRTDIDENDPISSRGRSSIRQEVRQTINRAAGFGKGVWPPFSVEAFEMGKRYEVRLLEYWLDKLPAETVQKMMRYLMNKDTHWGKVIAYIQSEPVQQRLQESPAVAARINSLEGAVRLNLKNMVSQAQNLQEFVAGMHREARQLMRS